MKEPGWYRDPNDQRRVRWWDGYGWTDRTERAADARSGAALRWGVFGLIAICVALAAFVGVRAALLDEGSGSTSASGDQSTTTTEPGAPATTGPVGEPGTIVDPGRAVIVVLASVPQSDGVEAAAARARSFTDDGVDAFLLDSNAYDTTRPQPLTADLFVVWTGPFASVAEADAFCTERLGGAGCFSLEVVPAG